MSETVLEGCIGVTGQIKGRRRHSGQTRQSQRSETAYCVY